jgi:DNA-binding transcriptional regulator YdaS (Cro superfamily)
MTLEEYFQHQPKGAKTRFAKMLGITRTYMSLLIAGKRRPSPVLANAIEMVTQQMVCRAELRPDIFGVAK